MELFYTALNNLVKSNLPPNKIIEEKNNYYSSFVKIEFHHEKDASINIFSYYSSLKDDIKLGAKIVKKQVIGTEDTLVVNSIVNKTIEIDTSGIINKLAKLYLEINDERFTVKKFFPRPNADEFKINIKAILIDNKQKNQDTLRTTIPLLVTGGLKIDFSTGMFLSNHADKEYLNKPIYANTTSDSISGYQLIKSLDKPLSFGVAAYLHAYSRSAGNINVSLTLGLGIDQNTQLKFMPGLSLLLGKNERFIVSSGLVIGKGKVLSKIHNTSRIYKTKVDPISYSENYNTGWFIGVSYNIGD